MTDDSLDRIRQAGSDAADAALDALRRTSAEPTQERGTVVLTQEAQIEALQALAHELFRSCLKTSTVLVRLGDVAALNVDGFEGEIVCANGTYDVWRPRPDDVLEIAETGLTLEEAMLVVLPA